MSILNFDAPTVHDLVEGQSAK